MKFYIKILSLFIIASCFFRCNNLNEESCEAISFPNEDSELALLMRELFEDSENVKLQIQEGKTPVFFTEFDKLHTATPTDENVKEDGFYTAYTDVFIETVEDLLLAKNNKVDMYNKMVAQCIDCHKQMCPGPIKKIRKLHIK